MARELFVNLPVNDLPTSRAFFEGLGFQIKEKFTNDKAACIQISSANYAMLLTRDFFSQFTKKPVADGSTTELTASIQVESKDEVHAIVDKAMAMGATEAVAAQDLPFMYARSFHDPDGHLWEFFWMDETKMPES